jgi:hypothetical protein
MRTENLDLLLNERLRSIRLTGDLLRIEEFKLCRNRSEVADFNSMLRDGTEQVNIERMMLTFNALGADSTFKDLKSLRELIITKQFKNAPIKATGDAFQGLSNLTHLELYFQYVFFEDQHYCNFPQFKSPPTQD